jgi:hypothetical protein
MIRKISLFRISPEIWYDNRIASKLGDYNILAIGQGDALAEYIAYLNKTGALEDAEIANFTITQRDFDISPKALEILAKEAKK